MTDPNARAELIRRIVTSRTPIAEPKNPDTCTVVQLLRALAEPRTVADVEARYREGGIGFGEAKAVLADAVTQTVAPMRERYLELIADPAALDERLAAGEEHARERAGATLGRVLDAMGL